MSQTYLLIMLFVTLSTGRPATTLVAEFNSVETCEAARKHLEQQRRVEVVIGSQGCFKK